jgi:hypothetical protein
VVDGLLQPAQWDPSLLIKINMFILINNAQDLMLYKFEFKPQANRIRKDFVNAEICALISWTKDRCISLLCYAASLTYFIPLLNNGWKTQL